ncbi:MAG: hypothetical protein MJ252_16190 [archaeon]|nr:hypothetical protein [archaeon]
MYFDGPEQNSSIKCNYQAWGQSNIQFGCQGNYQPQQHFFNKYPDTKSNYNIINLQRCNENCDTSNVRNSSIKTDYSYGKGNVNIFKGEFRNQTYQPCGIKVMQNPGGNQCSNEYVNSSIKVTQPIGGACCQNEIVQGSIRVSQMPGGTSNGHEYINSSKRITQPIGGRSHVRYAGQP